MKNELSVNHGVRKTQLTAYMLNNFSYLVLIVLVILAL